MITRIAIGVLAFAIAACGPSQSGTARPESASAIPPAGPSSGQIITITGHGLLERSETQFQFAADGGTYTVVMDVSTRCINLRGRLLGGYQLVARILMVTSLPITITGPVDGSTIHAQTVLIPTEKDALT